MAAAVPTWHMALPLRRLSAGKFPIGCRMSSARSVTVKGRGEHVRWPFFSSPALANFSAPGAARNRTRGSRNRRKYLRLNEAAVIWPPVSITGRNQGCLVPPDCFPGSGCPNYFAIYLNDFHDAPGAQTSFSLPFITRPSRPYRMLPWGEESAARAFLRRRKKPCRIVSRGRVWGDESFLGQSEARSEPGAGGARAFRTGFSVLRWAGKKKPAGRGCPMEMAADNRQIDKGLRVVLNPRKSPASVTPCAAARLQGLQARSFGRGFGAGLPLEKNSGRWPPFCPEKPSVGRKTGSTDFRGGQAGGGGKTGAKV